MRTSFPDMHTFSVCFFPSLWKNSLDPLPPHPELSVPAARKAAAKAPYSLNGVSPAPFLEHQLIRKEASPSGCIVRAALLSGWKKNVQQMIFLMGEFELTEALREE